MTKCVLDVFRAPSPVWGVGLPRWEVYDSLQRNSNLQSDYCLRGVRKTVR